MYLKEKAMILDSFVAIHSLRSVKFKIIFKQIKEVYTYIIPYLLTI